MLIAGRHRYGVNRPAAIVQAFTYGENIYGYNPKSVFSVFRLETL
jgi:hypothetical protein